MIVTCIIHTFVNSSRHCDRNTWSVSGMCTVDVMSSEVEASVSDCTLATNRFLRFGRNDGTALKALVMTAQNNSFYNYRFLHYACSAGAPHASVGMTVCGFVFVTVIHGVSADFSPPRHSDRNTWSASGMCAVDVMSSEVEASVSDCTLATNRFLRFGRNDGTALKATCHDSTAQRLLQLQIPPLRMLRSE